MMSLRRKTMIKWMSRMTTKLSTKLPWHKSLRIHMFRVSGTVRKGSKTAIYRHHFLMQDSLYPSLNGKRLGALQFCFTLYQLLFPCWHCTRRHAAAALRDSILNPSGQIRAFVIPKSNLIFVKAQNSSDKTLLKIAVVLFSVDNKINDEPCVPQCPGSRDGTHKSQDGR